MRGYFCIIIFSCLVGCNYSHIKGDPNGLNGAQGGDISPTAVVDWALIKTKVLNSCLDCHSGRTNPSLSQYVQVVQHQALVMSEVTSKAMPPANAGYRPLSACQLSVLRKWYDLGLPEFSRETVGAIAECKGNGSDQPPLPPIETQPLTYETALTYILQPKCMKCHNPDDPTDASGLLFYPYQEIYRKRSMWKSPSERSKIIRSLTRLDDERMPPPETGGPLNPEEIDFLRRWIDAGIPEGP